MRETFGDLAIGDGGEMDPAYAHLAAAVIAAAVRDCCVGTLVRSGVFRYVDDGTKIGYAADAARCFLSRPNADLAFWCARLGIDQLYVVRCYWVKLAARRRQAAA